MLRDIPIRALLVLGFLLAGLLPAMVGGLVSLDVGRDELKNQAFRQLEAVWAVKGAEVSRFFDGRRNDVLTLAQDPSLRLAYAQLRAACRSLGEGGAATLKGLDRGRFEAPASYREVHDRHIAFLTHYIRQQGYYDLLLLDDRGMAVFSVEKEADFGRDHARAASALGDAWREVTAGRWPVLTDMKLYPPSKDAPAQFVAAPIDGDEAGTGVLVLQVSVDSLDAIMGQRSGMGDTGETYLVGTDHRMRCNSVLSPTTHGVTASFTGTVAKNGIDTEAVNQALAGGNGSRVTEGYRGGRVLSVFGPLAVGDARWALVAQIDEEEIDRRIDQALAGAYWFILVVSAAAVVLLALLVSILIARHLRALSEHFTQLTEEVLAGDLDARGDPGLVGPDFQGLLAHANDLIDAFASRLNDLPVPVIMMDREKVLRFLNSAATDLAGRPKAEMNGGQCCAFFCCASCQQDDGCPAGQAMTLGRTVQGETVLATARGDCPVAYTTSPVYHPDGRLLGAWQILVDQSEAKRMAQEKGRLENELRRAQRLDALGTLSSGIAHDFNNILSYMLVYAELIERDMEPDSRAMGNLRQITTAVERAAELVRQMLVFARSMDGRREVFDAVPVVKDTLDLFAASLHKPVRLFTDLAKGPLTLEGDPVHLRQVVMNLCANARDALSEGGGRIEVGLWTVEPDRDPEAPKGLKAPTCLRLTVTDDGCGMDDTTRQRLFEPFFTTKAPGKGTGLGLSVVHGIVTTWGGAVTVQSRPREGSTLTVYLPLA